MSEPALVGVIHADGTFTARYLHWSGHPDQTVADLRAMWANRFSRDTTVAVAAPLHHDWHTLCPTCQHRRAPAGTITVASVGHALISEQPIVHGHTAGERYGHAEWMYLIDETTQRIRVYEATVHDRWLPCGHHPLDPNVAGNPTAQHYRRGVRVVLEHTNDPHTQLRPGDEGTVVRHLPQQHTVYVAWDSGSTLAMLLDAGDRIRPITAMNTPPA